MLIDVELGGLLPDAFEPQAVPLSPKPPESVT